MMLSYFTTLLQPRFKGFRQKFPKHLEGWKKIYDSNVSLSFLLLGCKPNVEMKSTGWLTLCDIPFSFLFCFTNQILYIIFSGASERGIAWRLERKTWPVSKNGDSAVSATRQGVWGLNLAIAFLAWKFFKVIVWGVKRNLILPEHNFPHWSHQNFVEQFAVWFPGQVNYAYLTWVVPYLVCRWPLLFRTLLRLSLASDLLSHPRLILVKRLLTPTAVPRSSLCCLPDRIPLRHCSNSRMTRWVRTKYCASQIRTEILLFIDLPNKPATDEGLKLEASSL